MPIAPRLRWYLDTQRVHYEIQPHPHSTNSAETARLAHVPPDALVKPVLLADERGYVMAIVPASRVVDVLTLSDQLNRNLELASESELAVLFHDCERGAVPPVGSPYRIPTVYDDAIASLPEIWFEAGDHEDVVHVKGGEFLRLLGAARHGSFSLPY